MRVWNRSKAGVASAVAALALVPGLVLAETPSTAETVFTDLETTVGDYAGYGWGLLAVVMTALVGMKLVKKFINRAS